MKFLVLGAGRIGYAIVYDLVRSPRVEQVIIADKDVERLEFIKKRLPDEKIVPVELDVTKTEELLELMLRCDVAIGCTGYAHNYELAKAALSAKIHFCDLGGNERISSQEFKLDEIAKEQDIAIIPNLGLAPGLVSILTAAAADGLDELYEIRVRVGGVPAEPEEPLNFAQYTSVDGLINEYVEEATIIRDGKVFRVPSLTDVEEIEFPKPFGKLEAFHASGGISTLPKTYLGKVQHLDYKAVRYPGHCAQMMAIKHLGMMSSDALDVNGSKVVPRRVLQALLEKHLVKDDSDVVLLRVTVTGIKAQKPIQIIWECIDYNEAAEGLTAMMRLTAYPASIVAQMIARGDIKERGVLLQEKSVPAKLFLAELAGRGITLTMVEQEPTLPTERKLTI